MKLDPNATAWSVLSDRASKKNFKEIDHREPLALLVELPVTQWNYKHNPARTYIGPTAQEFYEFFGLGENEKSITTLDMDGVLISALKGLAEELDEKQSEIDSLKAEIAEIRALIGTPNQN